jgi:hypothetical protein
MKVAKRSRLATAAILGTVALLCVLRYKLLDTAVKQPISRRLRSLFEWSDPHQASARTELTVMDCTHAGHPICCGLESKADTARDPRLEGVEGVEGAEGAEGAPYHISKHNHKHKHKPAIHSRALTGMHTGTVPVCTTVRKYIPSAYETEHVSKASALQLLEGNPRIDALIEFMIADIPRVNTWLSRIKVHTLGGAGAGVGAGVGAGAGVGVGAGAGVGVVGVGVCEGEVVATEEDFQYLSRFEVTRSCGVAGTEREAEAGAIEKVGGGATEQEATKTTETMETTTYLEWIEPLTVYGRHPFFFAGYCYEEHHIRYFKQLYTAHKAKMHFPTDALNVDYLLFKSGASIARDLGRAPSTATYQNTYWQRDKGLPRAFFLDAGTSLFPSSLTWFICSYLQVSFYVCVCMCMCMCMCMFMCMCHLSAVSS